MHEHETDVASPEGCRLALGPSGYYCTNHVGGGWEVAFALGAEKPDCHKRDLLSLTVAVARRTADPARLADLARVTDPRVAAVVAANGHTPPEVLVDLSGREEASVRQAVASHLRRPVPVLDSLALADEPAVRSAVARNPFASPDALAVLGEDDSDERVRREAKATLRRLEASAGRRTVRWRQVAEGWAPPRRGRGAA